MNVMNDMNGKWSRDEREGTRRSWGRVVFSFKCSGRQGPSGFVKLRQALSDHKSTHVLPPNAKVSRDEAVREGNLPCDIRPYSAIFGRIRRYSPIPEKII